MSVYKHLDLEAGDMTAQEKAFVLWLRSPDSEEYLSKSRRELIPVGSCHFQGDAFTYNGGKYTNTKEDPYVLHRGELDNLRREHTEQFYGRYSQCFTHFVEKVYVKPVYKRKNKSEYICNFDSNDCEDDLGNCYTCGALCCRFHADHVCQK